MEISFKEYFQLERKIKDVARKLDLKTTELKALVYMGENGFDVPLKRHSSHEDLTTQCVEERGATVIPREIGLDSPGQTIPNLVRKGLVERLLYSENLRKVFIELTPKGIELYNRAKSEF